MAKIPKRPLERLSPVKTWLRGITSEPRRLLEQGVHPNEPIPLRTRILLTVWMLIYALRESDLTVRAAATAYTFVFSIVPLLTTTLAFVTAFPGLQDSRASLEDYLYSHLLPRSVREIERYFSQFAEAAAAAGAVSTVVFIVTILLLFQSLESTFNLIWKAERARTWGERLQILALFFLVGALAVTVMVTVQREAADLARRVAVFNLVGILPMLQQMALEVGNILSAWVIFVMANKVLPSTHVRWRAALIGGMVAGTLWHLLKSGFTWYVENVTSYSNIYGAVGTVPVFFLWLYLTFLLLLVGAYTAFVVQNLRALVASRRSAGRGQQLAFHAVAVSALLARAFRTRDRPLDAREIAVRLDVSLYFVGLALVPLCRAGVVLAIPQPPSEPPRYLLAVPAESLTVGEVVRLASGEDLEVPEVARRSPMIQHISSIFEEARGEEGNVLERVTIATLELDSHLEPGDGSAAS